MANTTDPTECTIRIANLRKREFKHYRVTFRPDFQHTDYSHAYLMNYLEDLAKGKERKRKPPGVINVEQIDEPQ